jgi:hypothetical protein
VLVAVGVLVVVVVGSGLELDDVDVSPVDVLALDEMVVALVVVVVALVVVVVALVVVVVALVVVAVAAVVMVRLHPPAIDPVSPVASTTNSCQLPFGLMPVKAPANVVADDWAGAGAGNESGPFGPVGRYVPDGTTDVVAPRIELAAPSLNVKVALVAVRRLPVSPTSDSTVRLLPFGATSMASMSLRAACVTPVIVTLTAATRPFIPATVTAEG